MKKFICIIVRIIIIIVMVQWQIEQAVSYTHLKARALIKTKKMLFADQDAIFRSTTKKKILPRKYNEQSKFNGKNTVICHFCKRLLWRPFPHTENYKQWNVEEVHKILKCYAFDEDLKEYLELKGKIGAEVNEK